MRRIIAASVATVRARPMTLRSVAFSTAAVDSSPRSTLLQSALEHVPEHGWTSEAILAAVRQNHPQVSLSYATTLQATDLVQYFMETCNQELRGKLRAQRQSDATATATSTTAPRSMVERLHDAMRLRLEMAATYIAMGRWHQGMALGISQPEAALVTTEQLKELITVIAQETCTDDDGDSQQLSDLAQLSLGAVYVATECHMLSDTSVDYQDTWDFLRQTLQQWESLQQPKNFSTVPADAAFLASTLATAFGHGILSVSNLAPPTSLPTPDQLWRGAMNTANAFTAPSTTSKKEETRTKGSSSL